MARHSSIPSYCLNCGAETDLADICRGCTYCEDCCTCDVGTFDADEMGEEPEDEYERRTRG